ncbi:MULTISPECIES: DcrB-related protein [Sphingosinicellaceae]|uniref:DcrB-related protein n=1 Tax=Sphingosinicellaceae TaxID=2820280 RepID=UPI001C1E5590|nr:MULTISPECIES: DcrB-related protein [Polymorphobacter]QYE33219.1 DcrB-related protein [Polymorphobacter sp. PAMC 29334]UAJ12723.1 DcrB-related protein [Polymorphobacter megasporae]
MLYRMHEATFEIADELHDQTVGLFTLTPSGPSPFNIVITRMTVAAGTSLKDHVGHELDTLAQTLKDYELLWRREYEIDGRPAEITGARLAGGEGFLDQRQVFTLIGQQSLTITASANGAFTAEQLLILDRLVETFRFAG